MLSHFYLRITYFSMDLQFGYPCICVLYLPFLELYMCSLPRVGLGMVQVLCSVTIGRSKGVLPVSAPPPPPQRSKIFLISCSFWEILKKIIYVGKKL